jgi:hypothetical protein
LVLLIGLRRNKEWKETKEAREEAAYVSADQLDFVIHLMPPFSRKTKIPSSLRDEGDSAVPPCLLCQQSCQSHSTRVNGRIPSVAEAIKCWRSPLQSAQLGGRRVQSLLCSSGTLPGSHLSLPVRCRMTYYSCYDFRVDPEGFEPSAFSMPLRRAPNCAMGPNQPELY